MKSPTFRVAFLSPFIGCLSLLSPVALATEFNLEAGGEIYRLQCAECHGASGEGVADEYDETLYGEKSIEDLASLIHRTMPDYAPEECVDEDAANVAAYIHESFYSPEARLRNQPPRIRLSHLTVRQYENTVADLIGSFRDTSEIDDSRGIVGNYYKSARFRNRDQVEERVDSQIDFDFEELKKFLEIEIENEEENEEKDSDEEEEEEKDELSANWQGSLLAPETGDYEFIVRSENGIRLFVNDPEQALIDAWVSSGEGVHEHRATLRLLGGRHYPIRLDFFKGKGETASIELAWKPPLGAEEILSARYLSPKESKPSFVLNTTLPPDDSSMGYERGISVSKAWDEATTYAAIEVASYVDEHLDEFLGDDEEATRDEKIRSFAAEFTERAFRRPLRDGLKRRFVNPQFEDADNPETALKRVILLTLKSPRFLYPETSFRRVNHLARASRLSLVLWDSLPDEALLEIAQSRELRTEEEVRAQAERMLNDPRTKSKLRDFFHGWLHLDDTDDLAKDGDVFPDFNEELIADLRLSMDLFLDEVVWSGSSDYRQLLLADYLYLNDRLARFLGVENPNETEEFQKISFDPQQRAGVITHPYLLSILAYHRSTSPIHRGVFLTRNVLGRFLKPPPMAIQFMDDRFDPSLSMREKVTELTKPANCQSCHEVINPLGFSLEHYDAVGRYRLEEDNKPINAVDDYPTLHGDSIRFTGARDVVEHAVESPEAHQAFIQHVFHHMVKQPVNAYGPDTLDRLYHSFRESDFHIQKLIVEIATIATLHKPQS